MINTFAPLSAEHSHQKQNERKMQWVVYLIGVTMLAEIFFGYVTRSMALLADGFHMASHFGALSLS